MYPAYTPYLLARQFIVSSPMAYSYESIFHDVVDTTRLGQDKELRALISQHDNPLSRLYQEVDLWMRQLELEQFLGEENHPDTSVHESPEDIPHTPRENRPPTGGDIQESTTIPKVTSGERKASFGLMHMTQGGLSKPAATAVSNVNVHHKVTDLENKEYTPVPAVRKNLAGTFRDKIRQYRAKITHRSHQGHQRPVMVHSRHSNGADVAPVTIKAHRRSLAGELLPEYIRGQLHLESLKPRDGDSAVFSDTEDHHSPMQESIPVETTLAEANRFQNIVHNSQSFHASREAPSEASHDGRSGTDVSDADKEYILPSLFTRSLEELRNHDDMLLYDGSRTDDDDAVYEDHAGAESDDDYLFK